MILRAYRHATEALNNIMARVVADISCHRNALSSFNRCLPFEVKEAIFSWTTLARTAVLGFAKKNTYIPKASGMKTPVTLSVVCRQWRDLLRVRPRCWSEIYLGMPLSAITNALSRSCGTTIRVFGARSYGSRNDATRELAFAQVSRWAYANIELQTPNELDTLFDQRAPHLFELALGAYDGRPPAEFSRGRVLLSGDTPSLTRLWLNGIPLAWMSPASLCSLRSLSLAFSDVDSLFALPAAIAICTALQSFRLFYPQKNIPVLDSWRLQLPRSLQYLQLHLSKTGAHRLLPHINVQSNPALHFSFACEEFPDEIQIADKLVPLLQNFFLITSELMVVIKWSDGMQWTLKEEEDTVAYIQLTRSLRQADDVYLDWIIAKLQARSRASLPFVLNVSFSGPRLHGWDPLSKLPHPSNLELQKFVNHRDDAFSDLDQLMGSTDVWPKLETLRLQFIGTRKLKKVLFNAERMITRRYGETIRLEGVPLKTLEVDLHVTGSGGMDLDIESLNECKERVETVIAAQGGRTKWVTR